MFLKKIILFILKMILRVVLLPVLALVFALRCLSELALHIGAIVVAPIGFLLLYGLWDICGHQAWEELIIWVILAVGTYGAVLGAGFLVEMLDQATSFLMVTVF